jgi:hypothetical protein
MEIPFFSKDNSNDCGCAPVCLRMAAGAFGKQFTNIEQIYDLSESIGQAHYTLPWGMCLGIAKLKLHATYISKCPDKLLLNSRTDISQMTGLTIKQVTEIENDQVARCRDDQHIEIINWNDSYKSLPKDIVSQNKGVVIPTVWWGLQPHNIVLTKFDSGKVFYHDPNTGSDCFMTERCLMDKWIHELTDNDLLIVSKDKLSMIQ